ncbi:MAG: Glyoxalase/bleomycin resistance protein/dioxygenase [Rhodospirillales bacterium]|jgi:catechol 2,3-dioxygenase|nr:Glyoxalase/bleomycin resistance protein/dioxygenase [Rhodospirillales bacterium]
MKQVISGSELRASLHHLQLSSPDPEILARFYEAKLGMVPQRVGDAWVCRATDRCLIFTAGKPNGLGFAAYRVHDAAALDGLARRLRQHDVATEPSPTQLFAPGAVAFRNPDGTLMVFGVPREFPPIDTAMPARLQHVVVASSDAERMVAFMTGTVGLRISDRVLDDEGVLRTCFMRGDDEHHCFAVFQAAESRLDHYCFESRDWNSIRDWGDHFAAQHTQIEWGPGRHGPGNNLFIFIHDPDKNWVEISAELEIVPSDKPVGVWPHEERTLNSWGRAPLRS